jgi:hypothetical protein
MFCHGLIRFATLTKDTIGENKLKASISFQVHGKKKEGRNENIDLPLYFW